MTRHHICHALWEVDDQLHLCGRQADHQSWHLCACGEILHVGTSSLTDDQRTLRSTDCPTCLARAGRPCHTTAGAAMTGVHTDRAPADRH